MWTVLGADAGDHDTRRKLGSIERDIHRLRPFSFPLQMDLSVSTDSKLKLTQVTFAFLLI
jgi:hypothetical protein